MYPCQDFNDTLKRGEKTGKGRAKQVFKRCIQGKSVEEIAEICGIEAEEVKEILE